MSINTAIEVGINELTHPNPRIRARLVEIGISDCQYGCKYYFDAVTETTVLKHHATYGCKRTKAIIASETDIFSGTDFWLVPLGGTIPKEKWDELRVRVGYNSLNKTMATTSKGIRQAFSSIGEGMRQMVTGLNNVMTPAEAREALGLRPVRETASAE
jgi:hypothetical protein